MLSNEAARTPLHEAASAGEPTRSSAIVDDARFAHRAMGTDCASVTMHRRARRARPRERVRPIATRRRRRTRWGVDPQQRQQPVIVSAAVSDAVSIAIEGDAGNEHPVDACDVERRAVRARLGYAAITGSDVLVRSCDGADVEQSRRPVHPGQRYRLGTRQRRREQRPRVPFTAEGKREEHSSRCQKILAKAQRGGDRCARPCPILDGLPVAVTQDPGTQRALRVLQRRFRGAIRARSGAAGKKMALTVAGRKARQTVRKEAPRQALNPGTKPGTRKMLPQPAYPRERL